MVTIDDLLFIGIEHGDMRIVTFAIGNGANIHAVDFTGSTTFHKAAEFGRLEIGELLLEKGVDKNALNRGNQTALEVAVAKGKTDFIKSFLTKDDITLLHYGGNTLLHSMVTLGRKDMANIYINLGLDINRPNEMGYTPLHLTIIFDRVQILLDLLARHVQITKDRQGNTPLHLAATYGREEIAEILILQCCMFLEIPNNRGQTALQIAEEHGYTHIVEMLKKAQEKRANAEVAEPGVSAVLTEYLQSSELYNGGESNGNGSSNKAGVFGVADSNPTGSPNYRMAVQSMHRKPQCSRRPAALLKGNVTL